MLIFFSFFFYTLLIPEGNFGIDPLRATGSCSAASVQPLCSAHLLGILCIMKLEMIIIIQPLLKFYFTDANVMFDINYTTVEFKFNV